MSKKIVTLIMAAAFTVGCAGVSLAAKKGVDCEIKSVEGNTVTMECKNAEDLKAGMAVKVAEGKKKAVEGC